MKTAGIFFFLIFTFLFGCNPKIQYQPEILFDEGWLFCRGDVPDAEKPGFDDSSWRKLGLPHDWSIEDLPGTGSPLDSMALGGVSTGFFTGGTGWYRKHFILPENQKGKKQIIRFDGVYMNADIWCNGQHLGSHPYGYTGFWFDISELVIPGQENVISVQVKNEGRNSRWYSGSGIYRHVWLLSKNPVFTDILGTSVTTSEISETSAKINIGNKIVNSFPKGEKIKILSTILDPENIVLASISSEEILGGNSSKSVARPVGIPNPKLWSIETPALYTLVTEIISGNSIVDRTEIKFGIRTLSFDAENGFRLNGKTVLLKGGCVHHDNGPLGSAAYDRAEERRVELLKASGFNAVRCAHNPPSPAFLDACDRLGMLVIDEAFDMWEKKKNNNDYHQWFSEWWQRDIEAMVLRDRNHPSVIMWSTGNEIPERGQPEGVKISEMLADYIRNLDPSRPVTSAVNGLGPDKDPYFGTLDVSGYNYPVGASKEQDKEYAESHKRFPGRVIYCSESFPLKSFESWKAVEEFPYVIGDFVWTGFDYLGEASIGWLGFPQSRSFFPWSHAFCGDLDICGFKRPQSYYRDVLWEVNPAPSIFVKPPQPSFPQNPKLEDWSKWNWHDVVANWNWEGCGNQVFEVVVYCRNVVVELFLNGNSLGQKESAKSNEWTTSWQVPYEPGILKAVATSPSGEIFSSVLQTAGTPETIKLSPDRAAIKAGGQDLCFVTVELNDADGVRNPVAENQVEFEIEGSGQIIAVANSNPRSRESYQKPFRKAYQGRCLVIVRSEKEPGAILLKANSKGLQSAVAEIRVN